MSTNQSASFYKEEKEVVSDWRWAVKLIFCAVVSMIIAIVGIEKACHIEAVHTGLDSEQEFLYLLRIQSVILLPMTVLIGGVLYATISIFRLRWKQAMEEFLIGSVIAVFLFLAFSILP